MLLDILHYHVLFSPDLQSEACLTHMEPLNLCGVEEELFIRLYIPEIRFGLPDTPTRPLSPSTFSQVLAEIFELFFFSL